MRFATASRGAVCLDAVILSHLDEDHAGALNVLMQSEIDIGRVVMPSGAQVEDASTAVQNGFRTAEEKGVFPETYRQAIGLYPAIMFSMCSLRARG